MDFFPTQNHNCSPKQSKKRLTKDQVKLLEGSFKSNNKLNQDRKLHLSSQLGISERQVAVWYQNKRAKWKNQSLELDYTSLQVKLENALVEKKRVEKELEKVKGELEKTQRLLLEYKLNQTDPYNLTNCCDYLSASCDEGGSSSLQDHDRKLNFENGDHDQVFRFDDELYACLMGANGSNLTVYP